ncbi:MAG: sulfatase-like hydrolase/transferase, partial [Thermoleophilaceae bacterium]
VIAAAAFVGASIGGDGDTATAAPKIPKKPSVVLLIMDEFPVDQMLGPDGKIDAVRYPNFAALAATGTWFKNATTTYDSTIRATPEVMDAKLPRKSGAPNYLGHPESIYTIFGQRGYRVVSSEEATSVCPPRYCKGARAERPAILPLLQEGRRERLESFFSKIGPGRPTLFLKHVLLPHGPYLFLPSGKQTRLSFRDPLPGMNGPVGFGDRGLTDHNQQRLQLQIGFADHELGRLFARMKKNGSFNSSLIAVTADHGFAFEVGVKDRRTVTASNIDEIAPVPLFIKAPGQTKGSTSSTYARTIDIVPTIADILNFRMPYRADGSSAFSKRVRRRRFVRMLNRNLRGTITVSASSMERRRRALVRRKVALFGSGDIASLYTGIGPNRRLIGRNSADLRPAGQGALGTEIDGASFMRAVNPRSVIRPTQVAGHIAGGRKGVDRDLAVAVNGRIEAVGRSFHLKGDRAESYAMMVPEASIRDGRNSVQVFEVTDRGLKLRLIGSA